MAHHGWRRRATPTSSALDLVLTHDALHPGETLFVREALAARGVEVDHVKMWQTVGKLRRRHGLVMSGEPREQGGWVAGGGLSGWAVAVTFGQ